MTNFQSLVFYIILFSISTYFIYLSDKTQKNTNKKLYEIIGLAIPILISSLRWKVGTDFETYVYLCKSNLDNPNGVGGLFYFITKIAIFFGSSQYMFAIYANLTNIFIYKALKYNKDKFSLSLTFFLYLLLYFPTSFNIVRQSLAAAIFFYAYKFVTEKNLKKFIFWIIIASLAHTTALLLIFVYFIVPKDKEKQGKIQKIQVITIVGMVIIVLNYHNVLKLLTNIGIFNKYTIYLQQVYGANKSFLLNLVLLCVFLFFKKQLINYDKRNNIYIILYTIGVILEFTGYTSAFVKRIAIYFLMSNIFLLTSIPKIFNKKDRNIVLLAIILYAIVIFIISFYVMGQSNIIPYRTILMNK